MNLRENLPFRKNTEGYFTDNCGNMLARDTKKGYIVFPGGGVNNNEDINQGIIRETLEETGAIITNLKFVHKMKFIWNKNWAKTEKQKQRYEMYQGEEMHFFTGKIQEFKEVKKEDDFWDGKKLMPIIKLIELIESEKPFEKEMEEYRNFQLKILKEKQ
jgi:8-oxo-dGTP pyrophosphatase MutT (NUDIX family)